MIVIVIPTVDLDSISCENLARNSAVSNLQVITHYVLNMLCPITYKNDSSNIIYIILQKYNVPKDFEL